MRSLAFILIGLVAHAALGSMFSKDPISIKNNFVYGYLSTVGFQLATKIRQAEEEPFKLSPKQEPSMEPSSRIVEGFAAKLGDFPYQAGLIADVTGGLSVCGGSLLNERRVLTAAHCWHDGQQQARGFVVVLGSLTLFSGGIRIQTSKVVMHNKYNPVTKRNDIAMIYLSKTIRFSNIISPIALPSRKDVNKNFVGDTAIASGFGLTRDGEKLHSKTFLSFVKLKVISNSQCRQGFQIVRRSNICSKGVRGENVCGGDSGGPLVITRRKKRILIGVTSFGTTRRCQNSLPSAFTRVTSYIDWINNLLS
ncbi:unnamed protein product [Arctia plantaginis]|uniref:Peptidase S1 domain-containing protein n=1 Tax=Arctia plantaginis TaxID=874455 RepID=A0A8S1AQV9_ARCPL|nr:unnamed protein product [Arctia plantaginis]CAB3255778.1 unnamed protein product [Arctia plantaginis]